MDRGKQEARLTLGVVLFALLGFNLLLKDRNRDTGLRSLIGAWRQHRIDTARLIQRNNAATADGAGAAEIDKEIAQLEHRIEHTRIDETLYQPTRRREPGIAGPNASERTTTSGS